MLINQRNNKYSPRQGHKQDKSDRQSGSSGQSLVEFAVALVVLLLLIAGIVDVARAFFTYMALRDAAQEGALYGSTNPLDTGGITARVEQASNLVEDLENDSVNNGFAVNITYEDIANKCNGFGITVSVSLTDFPLTMPLIGVFVGSQSVPISAEVTDTILIPPCP